MRNAQFQQLDAEAEKDRAQLVNEREQVRREELKQARQKIELPKELGSGMKAIRE